MMTFLDKKVLELNRCCFVVQLHLVFDKRKNSGSDLCWPPRTRPSPYASSLEKLTQKFSHSTTTQIHAFFSQKLIVLLVSSNKESSAACKYMYCCCEVIKL